MADVSMICKRTVVSTKPVEPGKTYGLSVLDRTMEKNHIRAVYYYQSPMKEVSGELTRTLRESLSKMLSNYPIVTGRLQKDADGCWMIACNDAGVRMVETIARGSVEEWLQHVDREKELQLVYWEQMHHTPYYWSTFYVQVTEFEGGGFAIGLSCTHLLADPLCLAVLIQSWADTHSSGKMLNPLPFFHPLPSRRRHDTNHKPYHILINHYKSFSHTQKTHLPQHSSDHTTITLGFTDDMVSVLGASGATPFETLSALLWIAISRAKGTKEGLLVNMSILVDMRKVLGLDKGFFGNCMMYGKVNGDNLEGIEVAESAMAIKEVIRKMDKEGAMNLIEWLDGRRLGRPNGESFGSNHELTFVNLETVGFGLAVFEEGFVAMRGSYYMEPMCGEGKVVILPWQSVEGALGWVVMVTIREDEIIKLLVDPLIQRFSPTLLMGMDKFKS